jgi:hypothetical protein
LIEFSRDRIQWSEDFFMDIYNGRDINKFLIYNILIGADFKIIANLKVELGLGLSIIDSCPCWGFKPAVRYSFGKKERFFGKIALTHTLPKYGDETMPYGYLNVGGGVRIF